jgi:hypothetical protein
MKLLLSKVKSGESVYYCIPSGQYGQMDSIIVPENSYTGTDDAGMEYAFSLRHIVSDRLPEDCAVKLEVLGGLSFGRGEIDLNDGNGLRSIGSYRVMSAKRPNERRPFLKRLAELFAD